MKTQAQNAFNRRRSRIDWIAQRVMTLSGWLVLGMFLLLVGHITSNILPLFKTPTLQLNYNLQFSKETDAAHIVELLGGPALVAKRGCDVVLFDIQPSSALVANVVLKRFPFPCDTNVQVHLVAQDTIVTSLKASGLLEVFRLNNALSSAKLTLVSSVVLPIEEQMLRSPSTLKNVQINFFRQTAVAVMSYAHDLQVGKQMVDSVNTLNASPVMHVAHWFDLLAPQTLHSQILPTAETVVTLPHIQQLMLVNQNNVLFVDRFNNQLAVQELSSALKDIRLSPNQGTIYGFDENNQMVRWLLQSQADGLVFEVDPSNHRHLANSLSTNIFDPHSNAGLEFYTDGSYAFFNSLTGQVFSSRSDDIIVDDAQWIGSQIFGFTHNRLFVFELKHIQGITTFKELMGKNWYEGYDGPDYVWQTSSAAQHYDAKYSVIPLLIGSLKASLLALVVAIPLALGAAIYTAYFATSEVRKYLKPSIEMLEAVPSVIIGFIAAVWLAPLAEQFLISILIFIVLLPFFLVASAVVQPLLSEPLNHRFNRNWEIFFIVMSVFGLALFSFGLGEAWQQYLFSMNSGSQVDSLFALSKTTLIVAVALGVAISPTIYSLADDALNEVPQGLIKASFALGATRLQTLRSVVIRVALPSLISAIMLGFGRAFGETMIVLMVTGNTPISDWSIFEGLRSLTANLAIELQESNVNSAHFNILFLTAGLLFLFTFVLNTGAELFRNRLRKVVGHGKN